MREVFADTGYWIAVLDPKDTLHATALAISNQIEKFRIVTSEMVLAELMNMFAKRGSVLRELACKVVEQLRRDANTEIVPMTSVNFRAAVGMYCSRLDKSWSITDCASFLIMQEHGITEALAYDSDFEQAGFRTLLRDRQE